MIYITYIIAFILTIIIEILVAILYKIDKKELKYVALAQLTNPILNISAYLMYIYGIRLTTFIIAMLELIVVIIEGLIYNTITKIRKPMMFSLIANIASYSFGVIIDYIGFCEIVYQVIK